MSVDYAWTYLNSYYAWFVLSVSSLPLSVIVRSCHVCVNLRVVFVPWASFVPTLRSGSSPSPTRQRRGHIRMRETTRVRSFKFTVYGCKQTDIHTHNFRKCSHASVGLAQARPNYLTVSHFSVFFYSIQSTTINSFLSPECRNPDHSTDTPVVDVSEIVYIWTSTHTQEASASWVVYKLQLYLVLLVVMATCTYIRCDLCLSFPFV